MVDTLFLVREVPSGNQEFQCDETVKKKKKTKPKSKESKDYTQCIDASNMTTFLLSAGNNISLK